MQKGRSFIKTYTLVDNNLENEDKTPARVDFVE